jgi:hypothetical protein
MNYVTYDGRQHNAVKDLFPRSQQEKSTKEVLRMDYGIKIGIHLEH